LSVVSGPLSVVLFGNQSSYLTEEDDLARTNFEKLRVYQLAEKLSDEVWQIVLGWNHFARETVGKQLVTSADSVGANISEGSGRGSFADNRRFVRIARGSLSETQHWLRRAYKRRLLRENEVATLKIIISELAPTLNAYLKSIGPSK
jgi:four helix bundle protein